MRSITALSKHLAQENWKHSAADDAKGAEVTTGGDKVSRVAAFECPRSRRETGERRPWL